MLPNDKRILFLSESLNSILVVLSIFIQKIIVLKTAKKILLMVQVLYQELSKSDSNYFYIGIPKDWSGARDKEVTVIVDDVCVIVPQTIAGATGELIVLRLLEAMMEGNVIKAGDIQKAIEHIL